MPNIDLSGVHVPAVTPFDADGDVDLPGFRENLCCWSTSGIRGVVVGGSTGEAVLLDAEERRGLWETAVDEVGADLAVVAGTGAESTRTTVRMCRAAAAAGAHAVLVQPPAFYRGAMSDEALRDHYRAVAEDSPLPVILYQVPLRMSTMELSTPLVAGLAEHDNVVGIKDSRGRLDLLQEVSDVTGDDFQLLVGSGAILLQALGAGALGGILGVANLMPEACALIHQHATAGDLDAAHAIQQRVAPVHNGIVVELGVPGVKAGVDILGHRAGPPRSPLTPVDDAGRRRVSDLLEAVAPV
jgi:4-hydroxy-2-oxoglutarate aldolase